MGQSAQVRAFALSACKAIGSAHCGSNPIRELAEHSHGGGEPS